MTDKNFKDGCVFVVGGTGGVGSACVKSFHEAGANVVFSYNSNLEEAKKIEDTHNGVASIQLNLIDEDALKTCITKALSEYSFNHMIANSFGCWSFPKYPG